LLLQRCQKLIKSPPADDWDGAWSITGGQWLAIANHERSPTMRDRQPDFFCGSRVLFFG
jgi:hypothetical protein